MDLSLGEDSDDSLIGSDDELEDNIQDLSSFYNALEEHDNGSDWKGRCKTFWRDWRVKKVIGVLIAIAMLLSFVMIALSTHSLGTTSSPAGPWAGLIIGILILSGALIGGVMVFRGDLIDRF